MRTLAASPDYGVGSGHALTEGGSLLIASASGSQAGPLGANNILIINKVLVPTGSPRSPSRSASASDHLHEASAASRVGGS
jgi:hypothetical protein